MAERSRRQRVLWAATFACVALAGLYLAAPKETVYVGPEMPDYMVEYLERTASLIEPPPGALGVVQWEDVGDPGDFHGYLLNCDGVPDIVDSSGDSADIDALAACTWAAARIAEGSEDVLSPCTAGLIWELQITRADEEPIRFQGVDGTPTEEERCTPPPARLADKTLWRPSG